MRILIADDDPMIVRLVEAQVKRWGHDLIVAHDGFEAIAALDADPTVRLVLSDWEMPRMTGVELCRRIRELEGRQYTYFILLTAKDASEDLIHAYLTKPVDRSKLIGMVARFVGSSASLLPLVSTLADDEDLKGDRAPVRPRSARAIVRASRDADLTTLKRLAHQLKGAAGGFGFGRITDAAAEVERAILAGEPQEAVHQQAEQLAGLCRRARAA